MNIRDITDIREDYHATIISLTNALSLYTKTGEILYRNIDGIEYYSEIDHDKQFPDIVDVTR